MDHSKDPVHWDEAVPDGLEAGLRTRPNCVKEFQGTATLPAVPSERPSTRPVVKLGSAVCIL